MKPLHATAAAVGLGVSLLLAACGGPPDDAPARPRPKAQASASVDAPPSAAQAAPIAQDAGATAHGGSDIAELHTQVSHLRREVADLRSQLARLPGSNVTAAEAPPHPYTDQQARAEAEREERLRIVGREQAFRNEQVDARWSQGATASVRAALAGSDESLRGQVRSIECRAQSCRVEIAAGAGPAIERDLPLLVSRLGQALPNVTAGQIDQGDGRHATVLYLSQ